MLDRILAVYRDSVIVSACSMPTGDVGYAIRGGRENIDLVLDDREARELAAALAWVISEADRRLGKASFRPPAKRGRHDER